MRGNEDIEAYWYAGAIANTTAQVITHPIDLVRLLVQSNTKKISSREIVKKILEKRGILGFTFSLRSATQRQIIYSVMRFGFYEMGKRTENTENFRLKATIAAESGLVAGFLCTPFEKMNVRMCTDMIKPPHKSRNYTSVFNGVISMYQKGGLNEVYRCAFISSIRGMFMSVGQLAVYDEFRELFFKTDRFKEDWHSCFFASLIAGGVTTIIITPVEVVKLIFMDAHKHKYRSSLDVMRSLVQVYGYKGFYRGIFVSFLRIVPSTLLTFLLYEWICTEFNLSD
ncbi:mitochondrial dicarboxylate carrier [Zeugodacus cucurbitae]|uniref:Mitochondrial dicarboxylate carrier n=1 Tax=Zeugodacus cucurbitae TaxID=28588 RepID=A0A0A1X5E7_ZEUCU|nr:mitochondrial dicarboxylate carrier [Zeugodacus cucurbitae]